MTPPVRLWRARKRHDAIDALLRVDAAGVELEYRLNARLLLRRAYPTADEARAGAEARLRDLQRAGWNSHW